MLRLVLILAVLVTLTNCFSFEKFSTAELLSVSCDYATLVTRSRRSIVEPDLENPSALFDFLYPLADVKVDDHVGSRTVHQGSWMDDVGLLWQHLYCRRRPKRRAKRNVNSDIGKLRKRRQEEHTSKEEGDVVGDTVSWAGYLGSYFPSVGEPVEEIVEEYDGKGHEVEISDGEEHDDEEKIVKVEVEEEEEEEEDEDKESDEDEEEESTTATPAAETTTTPKPEDPYFSSYGGDIEYFIPLMSFTIPFDGEITLLGFHGFRGMFPY